MVTQTFYSMKYPTIPFLYLIDDYKQVHGKKVPELHVMRLLCVDIVCKMLCKFKEALLEPRDSYETFTSKEFLMPSQNKIPKNASVVRDTIYNKLCIHIKKLDIHITNIYG